MSEQLLSEWISKMSPDDQADFESLLTSIKSVKGDLSALSDEDAALLKRLSDTYNTDTESELSGSVDGMTANINDPVEEPVVHEFNDELTTLSSEFGQFVINTIDEYLCEGGASRADAIRYAFYNKFIPERLKDADYCETLFYRYEDEIKSSIESIEEKAENKPSRSALVAVGLAWFTFIYRAHQEIEARGDLADAE